MERRNYLPERLQGIKVEDIVVFRSMEELRKDFGQRIRRIRCGWDEHMEEFCGKEILITQEIMNRILHERDRITWLDNGFDRYDISVDMIKFKNLETEAQDLLENNNIQKDIIHTIQTSIFDKEKDKNIIKKMISLVDIKRFSKLLAIAGSSEDSKKMPKKEIVMDYLNRWANAKYEYFLLFGEKLHIEKNIEFDLDTMEMRSMIESLCYQFPKYALLLEKINTREFIDNSLSYDYGLSKYAPKHYHSGIKVSKFLSLLLEDEKFDLELSKVLQNRKVKGKMVISIDPYDYLTMSINSHNWRSCHNIADGEYPTGCFSYMCDEATLIAYRDNNKSYNYDYFGFKFKGNSKSWRQCIYFDKDSCAMIFGRQYPNDSNDITKNVRELIEDVVSKYLYNENKWVIKSNEIDGIYEDESNFHYSDVENDYDYKFARFKNLEDPSQIKFEVGSNVKCVHCGSFLDDSTEIVSCCNE